MNTIAKLTVAAIAMAALASGTTACSAGPASSSAATTPGSAALQPTATFCHAAFPAGAPQCGIKPTQIFLGVDASVSIRQITWSSWNASGASGSGSWYLLACTPSCVQGGVTKYPATLTLSAVQHGRFTVLVATLKGKKTIYHYPAPWPQSASGCVQSTSCDQSAGPSSSA